MGKIYIPEGYKSPQTIKQTEKAIKEVKDYFERALADALHLTRVSAPLFVKPSSGLNDNLNGVERPVSFGIKEQDDAIVEIVHSLAKWKRMALKDYGFEMGEGLYTDMTAIRRDEETDNIHSLYVDQWDWEKIIDKADRNEETLREVVFRIYMAIKQTEYYICGKYHFMGYSRKGWQGNYVQQRQDDDHKRRPFLYEDRGQCRDPRCFGCAVHVRTRYRYDFSDFSGHCQ